MSYEYKDYFKGLNIKESKKVGYDLNDIFNARDELNEVYSQASKADEYEAKAKAFDAIMREWEDERMTKSHILETIQKYYNKYESGEYDA